MAEFWNFEAWINFFAKIALLVAFWTASVFFTLISSRGYPKFGWCQHLLKIFRSTISGKYRLTWKKISLISRRNNLEQCQELQAPVYIILLTFQRHLNVSSESDFGTLRGSMAYLTSLSGLSKHYTIRAQAVLQKAEGFLAGLKWRVVCGMGAGCLASFLSWSWTGSCSTQTTGNAAWDESLHQF